MALLIGIAYFGFLFLPDNGTGSNASTDVRAVLEAVAPLLLALYLAWAWLWGGHRNALAFTPAEVQHLFPAPLTRRELIHFQLLRSQVRIVFSTLLFTLLLDGLLLDWWLRALSLWLLLTTIQLHQIGASLVHVSAETASGVRRNAVAIAVFLAIGGAVVWSALQVVPQAAAASGTSALAARLHAALQEPVARYAFLPFRLALAPLFAADGGEWLRALPAALGLLLLNYVWVLRTDAAFEEAAAEAGQRRAQRIAAFRAGRRMGGSGRRRPRALLFPLRPADPPWAALVWKNLVAFARGVRRNTLVLALVLLPFAAVLALAATESRERAIGGIATVTLILAVMLFLMGPLAIRNDLRQDLARVSLLRTWPLRGRAIVGAEVASAALVLGAAQLALLALSLATFASSGKLAAEAAILLFVATTLVVTPLNALALVVQNGLALHYPEWMHIGTDHPGGVEFMGQHILRLVGSILLMGVGLVPPLLVAGWVALQLAQALGAVAAVAAAATAIAALWIEVGLVVAWLGRAFERLDIVEAGLRS